MWTSPSKARFFAVSIDKKLDGLAAQEEDDREDVVFFDLLAFSTTTIFTFDVCVWAASLIFSLNSGHGMYIASPTTPKVPYCIVQEALTYLHTYVYLAKPSLSNLSQISLYFSLRFTVQISPVCLTNQ